MARKTTGVLSFAALMLALSTGCDSMSNTAKGGLIGGATGAGIGAVAGGGKGAVIGGLAGTVIGGVVGNDIDQKEKKDQQAKLAAAQANSAPLMGISDVIQMARKGWTDELIMNEFRYTHAVISMSPSDIDTLRANNISDNLISFLMTCKPPAVVVQQRPVYVQPAPVVVAQPAYVYPALPPPPPPGPSIAVGVGIGR